MLQNRRRLFGLFMVALPASFQYGSRPPNERHFSACPATHPSALSWVASSAFGGGVRVFAQSHKRNASLERARAVAASLSRASYSTTLINANTNSNTLADASCVDCSA
eukprot:1182349-Amphidinium_carterae.1